MERGRRATLVVVDESGAVRGATDPIDVRMPWWQEAGPVTDAVPGTTTLRLLEATPDATGHMGADVTYVVEHDAAAGPLPELHPWDGGLTDDPLRMPWARPGGPAADVAWVRSQVEVTGPPRQHRSWNLSAIWSFPAVVAGAQTTVWLKCVPAFFSHEAAVLRAIADHPVPRVVAAEDHRILLAELPGEDGYDADATQELAMVDALVDIQLTAADRLDALLAGGVPDHRGPGLIADLTELVERVAPDRPLLRRLVDELPDRLAEIDAFGLPDTLVHGDPHGGNCRIGVDPPIWFDWGDSSVGNPLLDLAATHRMSDATVQHWIDRWSAAVPGADPRRIWELLEPVARLREGWVYQRFLDNIEPSEHVYHHTDVPEALARTEQALHNAGW